MEQPKLTLDKFYTRFEKSYGSGRILAEGPSVICSTGSLSLDYALRTGGWREGRIYEVVGIPGCGKTTLAILSMAAKQLVDERICGYIDMEQTFDFDWAHANGLDTSRERFFAAQPNNAEDVSDMARDMIASGLYSTIVVDSIGGMESQTAFDKDAGEFQVGRNSQIITRMTKQIATLARQHRVTVILINQYRANIAAPRGGDKPAGPKILTYATSASIAMSRTVESPKKIRLDGEDFEVGQQFRAKVRRSKISAQSGVAEFWLFNVETEEYGAIGIDRADEAFVVGRRIGAIHNKGGGYYILPDGEQVRGEPELIRRLRNDPGMVEQIRAKALEVMACGVESSTRQEEQSS